MNRKIFQVILVLIFTLAFLIACEKPERIIKFITLEAEENNISYSSATLKREVIDAGSKLIEDHGILVSLDQNPRIGNAIVKSLGYRTTKGVFSSAVSELSDNTTYFFRAYVTIEGVDAFTEEICSFKTKDMEPPADRTGSATYVTGTSAILECNVNANNLSSTVIFEYGPAASYSTEVTADQSPVTGTTATPGSAKITGLNAGTTYHYRVKATNAGGTTSGNDSTFSTTEVITDGDGNVYNSVKIGTQVWMQENLKTTKFKDASEIPLVTDAEDWSVLRAPGYCWYDNYGGYKDTYGVLYSWYTTIDVRRLCPTGWHVPTDAEWTALTTYLGGESIGVGKLKETGTTHWTSPNTGATNKTSFTALPGGSRSTNGAFGDVGGNGFWWSSTELGTYNAWYRRMDTTNSNLNIYSDSKRYGFSIRCIKDW